MVVASEAKEPSPFDGIDPPRMAVLLHALCPRPETDPMCGGGIWAGLRDTRIYNPVGGVGLVLDATLGFSFGGGFETGTNVMINDRDEMGYGSLIAEAAIGPGFKLGTFELMPAIGLGGELIGWNSSKDSDDEGIAEGYWYALLSMRFAMGGGTALQVTGAHQLKTRGLERVYGDKIEIMFEFPDKKEPDPLGVGVWYWSHDSHLVVGLALSVVPRDKDDKKRRLAAKR